MIKTSESKTGKEKQIEEANSGNSSITDRAFPSY